MNQPHRGYQPENTKYNIEDIQKEFLAARKKVTSHQGIEILLQNMSLWEVRNIK